MDNDSIRTRLSDHIRDALRTISFKNSVSLKLSTFWSVDPVNRQIILLASEGVNAGDLGKPIAQYSKYLCGIALESRQVQYFEDINKSVKYKRPFLHKELIDSMKLKCMISVPILNSYNMQQVFFLMNIFLPRKTKRKRTDIIEEFRIHGESIALMFEQLLQDYCMRYSNRLNIEIAKLKKRDTKSIYQTLAKVTRDAVQANFVEFYLEKIGENYLTTVSHAERNYISNTESTSLDFVKRCWKENREKLAYKDTEGDIILHRELLPYETTRKMQSWVFVPVRDSSGQAKGVFSCLKSSMVSKQEIFNPFTYEDIAVIEAIGQSFSAHLEILMAESRRMRSLDKLGHELRLPITAFGAATQKIQREVEKQDIKLKFDYFRDIWFYRDVMKRLLSELDVIRKGPDFIPLDIKSTLLQAGVIAPAVRFIEPLKRKKGFLREKIKYKDIIGTIPALNLDPWLMTQVVFNLLENAIKYHGDNKKRLNIEIIGDQTEHNYTLTFSDDGIGVPEDCQERIFLQNVRGPKAHFYDVSGEGYGLWFSREIVRRHNGQLLLTNLKNPTEFTISLPVYLKDHEPIENGSRENVE